MTTRSVIAFGMSTLISLAALTAASAQMTAPPAGAQTGQSTAPAQRPTLSAEDRAAFIDAHLAAVKAGLKLTADQEKLWPPAEQAVRDAMTKAADARAKMQGQPQPSDMMQRMRMMADMATARGETMRKIVDAAQPLYASLSDDQKRRLGLFMNHGRRAMGGMGMNAMGMGGMGAMGMGGMGTGAMQDPMRGGDRRRPGSPGADDGSSRFDRSPRGDSDQRGGMGRGDDRFDRRDRDERDRRGMMRPRERFDRDDRDGRTDRRGNDDRDRRGVRPRSEERSRSDGGPRRDRRDNDERQ